MHLLELISQYGPPMSLSTNNGPPFASDEFAEFLMCHCIAHHKSSPPFPKVKWLQWEAGQNHKDHPQHCSTSQQAPSISSAGSQVHAHKGQTCQHYMRSYTTDPSSDQADVLNPSIWSKSETFWSPEGRPSVTNSTRHMEFEPYQNSPQANKSCSSPQLMMSTSLGPSYRRQLCHIATSLKHKVKSTAELGNMCSQSTVTCPHPSKVQIPIGSNAFQDPLHRSHKQQCFPGPSAQPHKLQAISGP